MNEKINMKNKIIIIAVLILAFAMILSLSGNVQARGLGDGTGSILKGKNIGSTLKLKDDDLMGNENIYCINLAKPFGENPTLTLKKIIAINESSVEIKTASGTTTYTNEDVLKYAQGLAYLLDYGKNSGYPDVGQVALWAYIDILYKKGDSGLTKIGLYNVNQLTGDNKIEYDSNYNITSCLWDNGGRSVGASRLSSASTLLKNVMKIVDGTAPKTYNVKFYVFVNTAEETTKQPILILHSSSSEERNPGIRFKINKVGEEGEALEGAKFALTAEQLKDDETTVDKTILNKEKFEKETYATEEGCLSYTIAADTLKDVPKGKKIRITIEEEEAPDKYAKATENLVFVLKYDNTKEKWVIDSDKTENMGGLATNITASEEGEISLISAKVKNNKINYFGMTINKSSILGENSNFVDGTKFTLSTSNVSKIEIDCMYTNKMVGTGGIITVVREGSNWKINGNSCDDFALNVCEGKVVINKIYLTDVTKKATITLTEKPVDGNATPNYSFKFDVSFDDTGKLTIEENGTQPEELKNVKVSGELNTEVDIVNYCLINVKGYVWLDGQTGLKDASERNGKYDSSENKLSEINVELYCRGDRIGTATTDENGEYTFEDIKYTGDMYVAFEYDGIRYIETNSMRIIEEGGNEFNPTDSHAREIKETTGDEIGRKTLNDKYTTVNSSSDLSYNYKTDDDGRPIAILETIDLIKAKHTFNSAEISNITLEEGQTARTITINCGLVKRELDLELASCLDTVTVDINGKSTDYEYSKDENGNAILNVGGGTDQLTTPSYTQYLYASDYNFNIEDYVVDDTLNVKGTDENPSDSEEINEEYSENGINKKDELSIGVQYKINLNNSSTVREGTQITEIIDYFSDAFDVDDVMDIEVISGGTVILGEKELLTDDAHKIDGYKAVKIKLQEYIVNEAASAQGLESGCIYIKFKINKYNEDGNLTNAYKCIKDRLNVGSNIAEISEYSTTNGYIDIDSEPDNMITKNNFEDDTTAAGSLNIEVEGERTLEGVVWDDLNKDGIYYVDDEPVIDDVTVQLVEIKDVEYEGVTYRLEYIWQQTTTSENANIIKMNADGSGIENVQSTHSAGTYKFIGYIPGNYIIRYKYGTEEGSKYDGNAYKSTYDTTVDNRYLYKYNDGDLKKATETINKAIGDRYSDAFDNEARRLGEMSLSAGQTISGSATELKKHWMCADTNRFALHVAENDKEESSTIQKVNVTGTTSSADYIISNIDFGLMERPKTSITLEKHITGLSIDVAGEGKILDAKLNINKWLEDKKKGTTEDFNTNIEGTKNSLSVVSADRTNKGFWKFETDVADLMNGAELSAEYTYVVYNGGDVDYLSTQLVNAYEALCSNKVMKDFKFEEEATAVTLYPSPDGLTDSNTNVYTYSGLLKELENRTQLTIRAGTHTNGYYLGDFYYTGKHNDEREELVTVQVDAIEELLNPELEFDEKINYSSFGDGSNHFSAYKDIALKQPIDAKHKTAGYILYGKDFSKENKKIESINDTTAEESYTVVQSIAGNKFLGPKEYNYDKKIVLTKTLNTSNINNLSFDSYIGEILSYSVASGRRDTESTPGNLTYSHSDDEKLTLDSMVTRNEDGLITAIGEGGNTKANESDEFWGETIIITSPTGMDKNSIVIWTILGTVSVAIIAGGIFGIKKFVLKH